VHQLRDVHGHLSGGGEYELDDIPGILMSRKV
jgi:hypothetical protein